MKNTDQDQVNFEEVQKKIKLKIFEMTKAYLELCEGINPIFIYLLVLIESLQILWFSIHPRLTFLNNPFLLSYFRSALAYVNLQSFIQQKNTLILPLTVLCSSMILLHLITLVISIREQRKKKSERSQFSLLINKIATIQIVLINTILFIPIFNMSFITIYCDQTSPYFSKGDLICYSSTHIVLCAISVINLLVLLIQALLYWFLFYMRNPFSKSYYALTNNLFRLGKLVIKVFPPVYFVVDSKLSLQNVYVIVLVVLLLAYIFFFRINSTHNFYQKYFYFEVFLEAVILWFCINSAICFQIPCQGMNFIQSCICAILFAYSVCTVEKAIIQHFVEKNITGNIKKQDREKFLYAIINVLFRQNSDNGISPLVYIKLLNTNLNICNIKISKFLQRSDLKTDQIMQITRDLIMMMIQKFFDQTPSINLKLSKCLILFDSGLKILSLHEISEMRNDKLSIYDEFMLYYFKATHEIFDKSQIKNNDDNINQITTYLEYTQLMNQFQSQLELCARNNQQFWEQLCEDLPSTNKAFNLAQNSINYSVRVEELYKRIVAIFPENLASLHLYFQFLNHVCARHKEYSRIKQKWNIQKQRQTLKQSIDAQSHTYRIKFRANDKMCVMHISTNTSTIGIVTNCNSQVKSYLGYEKSELINQKVTKIMPKMYTDIHDQFIKDYLDKADSMKLPVQKIVYAFKKNMRIVKTCLAVKIFPNIAIGFQLVGFFKEFNAKNNQKTIIVNMDTKEIQGMTEEFLKFAGNRIKLEEVQKQPFKLSHLFPQIDPNYKFEEGQIIETMFRFSDCTDKLIQVQQGSYQAQKRFNRRILLEVESINNYPGVQIGMLTIKQAQVQISMQYIKTSENRLRSQKHVMLREREPKRKTTANYDESEREQVSTQRKMEDFINSHSHLFQMNILRVVVFGCFVLLAIASIFINVFSADQAVRHHSLFYQIGLANNISIVEGKLLTQNQLLFDTADSASNWQQSKSAYRTYLKQLQSSITKLFEKSNQQSMRSEQLIINGLVPYQFKQKNPNNTIISTQNFHYYDGILQFVFTGVDLLKYQRSNFQSPITPQIKSSAFFIKENMKQMLPKLAQDTIQAFSRYFFRLVNNQLNNEVYFVIGKSLTFLAVYFAMCFVISTFSKFNQVLVQIYKSVLKWDAYELYSKCHKFRIKSSESSTDSNENHASDLFKVLPKGLIIQISSGIMKNSLILDQGQDKIKTSGQESKVQAKEKQSMKLENKISQDRDRSITLQPIANKNDLINFKLEITFKKKFIFIFFILLLLISINFSALFFKDYNNNRLLQQKLNTINLAKYTKNFLFTFYYGNQVIYGNTEYTSLYHNQLESLYNMSKNVGGLIGDPIQYIRQVYKQIQILNSIINGQLTSANTENKILLQECHHKLLQISQKIRQLSQTNQNKSLTQIEQVQKLIKTIKIVFDVLITIIFCWITHTQLLKSSQIQLKHSCNMLKMIPVWLIKKNHRIKDIIFKNDKSKIDDPVKESVAGSSVMLIDSVRISKKQQHE